VTEFDELPSVIRVPVTPRVPAWGLVASSWRMGVAVWCEGAYRVHDLASDNDTLSREYHQSVSRAYIRRQIGRKHLQHNGLQKPDNLPEIVISPLLPQQ